MLVENRDFGTDSAENSGPEDGLGLVADVVRTDGEKYFPVSSSGCRSPQKVEEQEEGHLTALCDGDILFRQLPVIFVIEIIDQHPDEFGVAARVGISTYEGIEFPGGGHFVEAFMPEGAHFREEGGASAVELANIGISRVDSLVKVFH